MEIIKLIFAGLVIGIANVIPGVSGGTMAVVFGVYDRLVGIITLNVKKIFAQWKFWLPLGAGMGIGILLFSKAVQFLFEHFPVYTSFFFTGIVAGSIPMLWKRCAKPAAPAPAPNAQNAASGKTAQGEGAAESPAGARKFPPLSVLLCALVFFALMLLLTFFNTDSLSSAAVQTELTAALAAKLFFGGTLAAIAMIIPGVSGSFLMLVLGIYATIIGAVADLNIVLLIPVALGAGTGLLAGAGLVRFLMAKVPQHTYGGILGLVVGSIFAVAPIAPFAALLSAGTSAVLAAIVSLVCAAAGFALAFFQKADAATAR